jgi:hypothetical protein
MGKRSKTEFEGFHNLLSSFTDESVFGLRLIASVLDFEVHLPAYIIGQIEKRPRVLREVVETELRSGFVD